MGFPRFSTASTALLALMLSAATSEAQTARQLVTFSVIPASRVAMSSVEPVAVRPAGRTSAATGASISGSHYGITTNEANQKITAAIDSVLPAGMTLTVNVAAPKGAASTGARTLGTASLDVVTGISAVNADDLPISYSVSSSSRAA